MNERVVPRLRLSPPAFDLAVSRRPAGTGDDPDGRAALAELAAAGALVRRADGALLVDPALQAALTAWSRGAVTVEALSRKAAVVSHVRAAIDVPLAVCVARRWGPGGVPGPVEVTVPQVGRVVQEVVSRLVDHPLPGLGTGWLRVGSPSRTWAATFDGCSVGAALLTADASRALVGVLEHLPGLRHPGGP